MKTDVVGKCGEGCYVAPPAVAWIGAVVAPSPPGLCPGTVVQKVRASAVSPTLLYIWKAVIPAKAGSQRVERTQKSCSGAWTPAFAGVTSGAWTPAFAGVTSGAWTPAFAGVTNVIGLMTHYTGGCWLVNLSSASPPGLCPGTVAQKVRASRHTGECRYPACEMDARESILAPGPRLSPG